MLNFMQSAATLIANPKIKVTINALKVYVVVCSVSYLAYGVILLIESEFMNGHVFDCHNVEFIIQNSLLMLLIIIFHFFACKVNTAINNPEH